MSVFEKLSVINVNDKKSKKNNLDYLSWAFAWSEVKKVYPEANSKVYENEQGLNYHTDGRTAWVKVGMTIEGLEHIEYLPVMDYRNQSIPVEKLTSMDVNKTIQRGLVKAIARHGLGLYIYANEDLPDLTEEQKEIMKLIAEYILNEGAISIAELNAVDTDLWRKGVMSFGILSLSNEMQTLSKFILKVA